MSTLQRCNDAYAISSAIVSSEFTEAENQKTLEQAVAGTFKILFIAPERLENALWQSCVPKMRISMIVIDEAHCISTWGHDFRPNYRRIVRLLTALPKTVPVLALTATASTRVEQDILNQMGQRVQVIRGTMQRPNLYLHVERLKGDREKLSYLAEILPYCPGTGIIYTATRADSEMVAGFLAQQGLQAEYYHGGREDTERLDIQQNFMANQYNVICSTNALGMGIDKPDIRFIIHYHIPASPIHYYQEMGRAGRDGKVSWCILLYDEEDLNIQEHFIDNAKPDEKDYYAILSLLQSDTRNLYDIMFLTGLSEQATRTILADLDEQHFIQYNAKFHTYAATFSTHAIDFTSREAIRLQKQQESGHMQQYVQTDGCYMKYLTAYFGDQSDYYCGNCGHCNKTNFPFIQPSARIQGVAARFLEEEFLPRIEKWSLKNHSIHEAGWSLAYYGRSSVGKLVRASKYENAGPFALSLVMRTVEIVQTKYPVTMLNGIVSVPPTKSGILVETFARQVADMLGIEYISVLAKVRPTQEQKILTNSVQKSHNVRGAFYVRAAEQIQGRILLLIDDIYDSGHMLREIGYILMQAGAKAVYPFTITRTSHSDNQ